MICRLWYYALTVHFDWDVYSLSDMAGTKRPSPPLLAKPFYRGAATVPGFENVTFREFDTILAKADICISEILDIEHKLLDIGISLASRHYSKSLLNHIHTRDGDRGKSTSILGDFYFSLEHVQLARFILQQFSSDIQQFHRLLRNAVGDEHFGALHITGIPDTLLWKRLETMAGGTRQVVDDKGASVVSPTSMMSVPSCYWCHVMTLVAIVGLRVDWRTVWVSLLLWTIGQEQDDNQNATEGD